MQAELFSAGARPWIHHGFRRVATIVCMIAGFGCARVSVVDPVDAGCLRDSYDAYPSTKPISIPDADAMGVVLGPVRLRGGSGTIQDVVLALELRHKSPADVDVWLWYDSDSDIAPEGSARVEFFRGRADGCAGREPHSCPMELEGTYWFRDDNLAKSEKPFAVFNGLESEGAFYLVVRDTLAQDVGEVTRWTLYVRDAPKLLVSR